MGIKRGRPSRAQMRIAEEVGPTPETIAKLQGDALLDLVTRGDLTVDHERAGREINAVWEELERLFSRTSGGDMTRVSRSHRDLPDTMSFALARRLQTHHQPWASREIEKRLAPGVTRYGVVWRLCNLNWPRSSLRKTPDSKNARWCVRCAIASTYTSRSRKKNHDARESLTTAAIFDIMPTVEIL